jgi:hypothetical protein
LRVTQLLGGQCNAGNVASRRQSFN